MAHVKKMTRAVCGHMFKHYERAKDDTGEYVKFGNESIDTNRSSLNYNLGPAHRSEGEFIRQRCSEVKMQNRKDVNVMCSWVLTAPKDLPESDFKRFFVESYTFLSRRYGSENVVSSYVHMDEVTPHMHFAFVPVTADKKNGGFKVSAKEVITRWDLQTFHQDLSKHLEHVFGRDIGILNEATINGNKSIDELKRKSATERLQDTAQEAARIVSAAQKRVKGIEDTLDNVNAEYEAKKAFITQAELISESSKTYPEWAVRFTRGIIKKQEYVTVPVDRWEARYVSAEKAKALQAEQKTVEAMLTKIRQSDPTKEIQRLKKLTGELFDENEKLRRDLSQQDKSIERVSKVFDAYPELKERFYTAEAEIQRAKKRERGMER